MELARLNRREAIQAGVATAALSLLPAVASCDSILDRNQKVEADYIANEALRRIEARLPKLDRAYAGHGIDGERFQVGEEEFELQHLYAAFAIYDSEMLTMTTPDLVTGYLDPAAMSLASIFEQPGLKHIVTRRLEPAQKLGALSTFAFKDFFGLRSIIAYERTWMPGRLPFAKEEGRTLYVIDMLAGIKAELAERWLILRPRRSHAA